MSLSERVSQGKLEARRADGRRLEADCLPSLCPSSSAHPESANAYVTIANRHFYDPACLDTSKPAIPALRRNSKSHAACLADAAAVNTASYTGMLAQSSTFSTPKVRIPPQVPNAGRGLAPVEPFQQGTIIHSEKPMLCFPFLKHVAKVWPSTSTFWAALAWVKILDSADPCTLLHA